MVNRKYGIKREREEAKATESFGTYKFCTRSVHVLRARGDGLGDQGKQGGSQGCSDSCEESSH